MAIARAQGQGGVSAIHVWLIAFVALWLTATVFLVILYLDKEDRDNATAEAQNSYQQATKQRNDLQAANSQLIELMTGDSEKDSAGVQSEFDELLARIRSSSLVDNSELFEGVSYSAALNNMYEAFRAKAESLAEAERRISDRSVEFDTMQQTLADLKKQYDEQAMQLRGQVSGIEDERGSYRRSRDEEIDAFEQQIEAIKQQCSDDIQTQRGENVRLKKDYEELLARYQELKDKLGQSQVSPIKLATARVGDGQILKSTAGDDVVYIDLGARDHLTLGLEFAVYDSLTGIPEDGRAKARIEVVRIHEESAECRIVESITDELVMAGDVVANPVYDRHRKLSFFVLGDFDLDGDGRGDPDGKGRIEAIVEDWGGVLQGELSARVDFVVLGGPPHKPTRSRDIDVEDDVRYQAAKVAYDTYESELSTVEVLAIPTLTQSVFLNFLGYSSSGVRL